MKIVLSTGLALLLGFTVWQVTEVPEGSRGPSGEAKPIVAEAFVHIERLRLSEITGKHLFLISNTESYSQVVIYNDLNSALRGEQTGANNTELDLDLNCNQEFQMGLDPVAPVIAERDFNGARINHYRFHLKEKKTAAFLFSPKIQSCTLSYRNPLKPSDVASVEIHSETLNFPWLREMIAYQERCAPANEGITALPQLSCPHTADSLETLETPELGFLAKTEMLLGQRLDPSFITHQDPYAEIDFSKAPKLDAIFLATLVYRADFYGTVLGRLLKYHADRGTVVHLITTGYMMLDKDKKLLYKLAENGNFRLQEFKYYDPNYNFSRPFRYVSSKYRDMHIKLLITLGPKKENNAVVFGGRNIHDGFLFKTKPDFSKYPDLVQYGVDDDFVHWNDFEMKVTSPEMARVTAAHLLKFWNRDTLTQTMVDFYREGTARDTTGANSVNELKHFISLPYNDHQTLEKLYVSLIDQAQHTIRISSPYLRPTDKIMAALLRAVERKVDIVIQTRVSLIGDTQAWLYEEVNKESINKLFDKIKIYEWKEDSILHSKFILVDGAVGFIGSVNLSRRSFVQDVENGFIIKDRVYLYKMDQIFNSYVAKSAQITEKQKRKIGPSLLIKVLKNQF